MRLVGYLREGQARVGALTERGVVPTRWRSFAELFAEADPLAAAQGLRLEGMATVDPERLLPPLAERSQIVCTGGNYSEHLDESRDVIELAEPIFVSALWSAVIGPDDEIAIPAEDAKVDYEVELAVVIGRRAHMLSRENAIDHVFGYTVLNDVSAREAMLREPFQLMLSKSPDTFCPVGPHLVTRDEIPEPHDLEIASYLNGELRQHARTSSMGYRIPELLETLTRTVTLHPGAIVTTGTPGGVGLFRDPPEFMQPGDVITAAVEGVGELTNRVIAGW
jgi:2-keto-4-pentenoate hydratase/2-oxohepta-3-ene-1,7-dioic acid hydratase in catechol pathway